MFRFSLEEKDFSSEYPERFAFSYNHFSTLVEGTFPRGKAVSGVNFASHLRRSRQAPQKYCSSPNKLQGVASQRR